MKNKLKLFLATSLFSVIGAYAQTGDVGINTPTPDVTAALDITSTTKGLLIPRMSTTDRTGITTPATGLMVYDTDTKCVQIYNGSIWDCIQNSVALATTTYATPGEVLGSTFTGYYNGIIGTTYHGNGDGVTAPTYPVATAVRTGQAVTSATISNQGNNFVTAPSVIFSSPVVYANITGVVTGGVVTSVTVSGTTARGYFNVGPINAIIPAPPAGGTPATISVTPLADGTITAAQITITNGGSGYTGNINISIDQPSGWQLAKGTANLTAGKVTSITITQGGTYSANPTIAFRSSQIDHSNLTASEKFSDNTQCATKLISVSNCTPTELSSGITDLEGNNYPVVQINGQCWMAQNMKQKAFSTILNTGTTWGSFPLPDIGSYGYTSSLTNSNNFNNGNGWGTTEVVLGNAKQGMLYQWSAAMNKSTVERARGICPSGWHIPSDCEFQYLEHGLGMSIADQNNSTNNVIRGVANAGISNKLTSEVHGGSNASGFNAVGTGVRQGTGDYRVVGSPYLATSTAFDAESSLTRYIRIHPSFNGNYRTNNGNAQANGVRCLKN